MKILTLLLALFAAPASAGLTCETNSMTEEVKCTSESDSLDDSSFYYLSAGSASAPSVTFVFYGQHLPIKANGVLVKLDDGKPFKVAMTRLPERADCIGRKCGWIIATVLKFTPEQLLKMAAAKDGIASYTYLDYVSDPIKIDPAKIAGWYEEWKAMQP
jgi:hypothetical protein